MRCQDDTVTRAERRVELALLTLFYFGFFWLIERCIG